MYGLLWKYAEIVVGFKIRKCPQAGLKMYLYKSGYDEVQATQAPLI